MHYLAYGFFDMFASITQVQSHYSLYSFWTRLKWFKITQFLHLFENFKRQTWKTKLKNWHEKTNKSEIIALLSCSPNLLNDCTIYFGAFSLFVILYEREALAIDCLYFLNALTAWQVCIEWLTSISLVSKSKLRAGKPTSREVA